ncbi:hypothetical protein GCM10022261_26270 [Brevibacterium daeguense]|uniref:Uncharacterized protein n=1 Tax=Brevibacterium daeguense TaxID=909936 RepID=A0ABP8EM63_9MICO|nr:hypothetical protein [Brevibacterium daeguense]
MNDTLAADLHAEVRRLRIRVAGFDSAALDLRTSRSRTRRAAIRSALARLSDAGAGSRLVPELEDRVLADQLVVLLTDCSPEYGATEAMTKQALAIARDLRVELG